MRFSGSFFGLITLVLVATVAVSFFTLYPKVSPFRNALSRTSSVSEHPILAQAVKGVETEGDAGTVKKIIDGDTIVLSTDEKVRLIGINAPEESQPFYQEAKDALTALVLGKSITLQYDVDKKDTYGRTLAYILVGDSLINKQMVDQGLAVVETIPPNVAHAQDFVTSQLRSREQCNGMWQGLCAQGPSACIQISHINSNPKGVDTKDLNAEWIELQNTCSRQESLDGYLVKDSSAGNSYTFKKVIMVAKQSLKLHSGCGNDSNSDIYWACPAKSNAVWNNAGDHAYLYDNTGKLVSEMGY